MLNVARIFTSGFFAECELLSKRENPFPLSLLEANVNSFGISIYPCASLLRPSCCPNTQYTNLDSKFVVHVQVPVKKGEQIFFSYRWVLIFEERAEFITLYIYDYFVFLYIHRLSVSRPIQVRRRYLLNTFNFACSCAACEKGWMELVRISVLMKSGPN